MASNFLAVTLAVVATVLGADLPGSLAPENAESVQQRTQGMIRRHEETPHGLQTVEVGESGEIKVDAQKAKAPPALKPPTHRIPPRPPLPPMAAAKAAEALATEPQALSAPPNGSNPDTGSNPDAMPIPGDPDNGSNPDAMPIPGSPDNGSNPDAMPMPEESDEDADVGGQQDDEPAPSPAGEDDDYDDSNGTVPVPAPAEKEAETKPETNNSALFPPQPSPPPPPPPVSTADFLGPQWHETPVAPSAPDHEICKNVTGISVLDRRDVHHVNATVSHQRHGERKHCGMVDGAVSVLNLGTFPNGRLHSCAEAVANNASCGNEFQLEKETYKCDCVTAWSYCVKADENNTCVYDLNPGAGVSEEVHTVDAGLHGR
jgi:hypothetical protein